VAHDGTRSAARRDPIPWRLIFGVIGAVVVTAIALDLLWQVRRILTWIIVALFFAVVLEPVVARVERVMHLRRGLAVLLVVSTVMVVFVGIGYLTISPLVTQVDDLSESLPQYVEDAENGRGNIGRLAHRVNADEWLRNHSADIESSLTANGRPIAVAKALGDAAVAALTIFVLTILMLLEGPEMLARALAQLPDDVHTRVKAVGADCARAVTGYVAGNLLISLIAGVVTYITLTVLDVPFAGPLAFWVGVADLIPLVGATLGAAPAVLVALLHSTTAGIITLIVFIVYQQFENHVLQVTIMAKTVALKPLVVLVSVLVGVELFGIVGALLAIPVAGVIQVIGRDLWDNRRARPKDEPTIGADEVPVDPDPDPDAIDPLPSRA
jgi:predicted PurR-regulated permease PerM